MTILEHESITGVWDGASSGRFKVRALGQRVRALRGEDANFLASERQVEMAKCLLLHTLRCQNFFTGVHCNRGRTERGKAEPARLPRLNPLLYSQCYSCMRFSELGLPAIKSNAKETRVVSPCE